MFTTNVNFENISLFTQFYEALYPHYLNKAQLLIPGKLFSWLSVFQGRIQVSLDLPTLQYRNFL